MHLNQSLIVTMASLTTTGASCRIIFTAALPFSGQSETTQSHLLSSLQRVWVLRTASQFFNELQAKYQRLGTTQRRGIASFPGLPLSSASNQKLEPGRLGNEARVQDGAVCILLPDLLIPVANSWVRMSGNEATKETIENMQAFCC